MGIQIIASGSDAQLKECGTCNWHLGGERKAALGAKTSSYET